MQLTSFVSQFIRLADTKDIRSNKKAIIALVAILAVWLALVVFTETRHEFWRDEVRPLSLARQAASPLELYNLIQYDGHPVLWYLLLWVGNSIFHTRLVLPVTAVLVGFASVAIFMFFAPFPLWLKCLFIFGGLPLYEYSVMARNYGISMVLMFTAAALYPQRARHPYRLAVTLALLANTNAHSALLVGLLALVWVWDGLCSKQPTSMADRVKSLCLPLLIVLAGVALCAVFVYPRENTILTHVQDVRSLETWEDAALNALRYPYATFRQLLPAGLPKWAGFSLLTLPILGLIGRPALFLAALGAQVGLGVFFRLVYIGQFRHQGLYLVFLLTLFWIFTDQVERQTLLIPLRALNKVGFFLGIGMLLIFGLITSTNLVRDDIYLKRSSSKDFGAFLKNSETYRDAILVPEPESYIESLPYYADNPIYLPREHRFSNTVAWTTAADAQLSLGDLLATARSLKLQYNQPILIVLGHVNLDPNTSGTIKGSYNKVFSWKPADFTDLNNSSINIANFDEPVIHGDIYRLYAVK